jgi:hypothetical protein
MDNLIINTLTAFIKGRCIYGNIMYAQKVLHHVRKTKTKGIMLKLDFKKASDNFNWNFY